MSSASPAVRGIHRRLAFPPPPARPSLAVLRELNGADDDLARAVFLLSRRVRDLADAPPFGVARWTGAADVRAAAANTPEIAADLLFLGAPDFSLADRSRGRAAGACHRLADWAAELGYGELAIQLAEAAIAILPGSARHSYEAGRLNRLFGRFGDAEALYSRAITLARPGKHWWVYVRAHLGLGNLSRDRGEFDRAAAHYATAARTAHDRSGEKWLAAMIEHDLFILSLFRGDLESAHQHAVRTHEWMPTHHQQVPALVHDYAYLLLQTNAYALAMTLLAPLVEKRLPSAHLVLAWSAFARAAAGLGEEQRFRDAEQETSALLPRSANAGAGAHLNLAFGAQALGLTEDAKRHAARSAELARIHPDAYVRDLADKLLETITSGETVGHTADPDPSVRRFAHSLTERLSVWRGLTWKRKQQADRSKLGVV